jgi:hypothetical protein
VIKYVLSIVLCVTALARAADIAVGDSAALKEAMDCVYANNVIVGKDAPLVKFQDQPINTMWLANFMFGADAGFKSPGVVR